VCGQLVQEGTTLHKQTGLTARHKISAKMKKTELGQKEVLVNDEDHIC
jgi:hypothetical protein